MLLNDYAHRQNYEVVREVFTMGTRGAKVRPDGILKNLWGIITFSQTKRNALSFRTF